MKLLLVRGAKFVAGYRLGHLHLRVVVARNARVRLTLLPVGRWWPPLRVVLHLEYLGVAHHAAEGQGSVRDGILGPEA